MEHTHNTKAAPAGFIFCLQNSDSFSHDARSLDVCLNFLQHQPVFSSIRGWAMQTESCKRPKHTAAIDPNRQLHSTQTDNCNRPKQTAAIDPNRQLHRVILMAISVTRHLFVSSTASVCFKHGVCLFQARRLFVSSTASGCLKHRLWSRDSRASRQRKYQVAGGRSVSVWNCRRSEALGRFEA